MNEKLIDIERAVLGSMLISAESCRTAIHIFEDEDFKVSANRLIFNSIRTMHASGQPVDAVTVNEFLRTSRSLALVGGTGVVAELINFGSDIAPLEYYAKRLKGQFD